MTEQHFPLEQVEDSNTSNNPHFNELLNAQINRRSVLRGGAGMTAAMMFGGLGLVGCGSDDDAPAPTQPKPEPTTPTLPKTLNFKPVAHSKADRVVVPEGYQVQAFAPTGTPLTSEFEDWNDNGLQVGESFEHRVGDNHDGLAFYGLKDGRYAPTESDRGLIALNHEYVESDRLNPLGFFTRDNAEATNPIYSKVRLGSDVRREVNAHGVTVMEVVRDANGQMSIVKDSPFNRRFTSMTTLDISGPAAGSELLVTKFDRKGLTTRGMNNQCGSNQSPWGTYITVEENFLGVFARGDDAAMLTKAQNDARARYGAGVNSTGFGYLWHTPP
ncbi:MAG: alkaline phosphatase PhoX, partial [Pseudomonadota bacterium]|nr:alkaline phosphatase PhoX [Pseudomonadota bacterium]